MYESPLGFQLEDYFVVLLHCKPKVDPIPLVIILQTMGSVIVLPTHEQLTLKINTDYNNKVSDCLTLYVGKHDSRLLDVSNESRLSVIVSAHSIKINKNHSKTFT